jgi:hypothetical protein
MNGKMPRNAGSSNWWRTGAGRDRLLSIWPFLLVALLCAAPALAVLAMCLVSPWLYQSKERRRVRRLMHGRGRYISWAELLPNLISGLGTLIIDHGDNWPIRLWWTPDDVLAIAPCPPPNQDRLLDAMVGEGEPDPFIGWCCLRFTDLDRGTASFTIPPRFMLPVGVIFYSEFLRSRFPRVRVVETVSSPVD